MDNKLVYLDYNATSPIDLEVLDTMVSVYRDHPGNADSRTHAFGTDTKSIVSGARKTICSILGISETELVFTSGSTESNNLAVLGMKEYAIKSGRKHFITSTIEHKSVLEGMKYLQSLGFEVDFVSPGEDGRVKAKHVLDLVRNDTALVSIMHVNSETGIIQPVNEIGAALSKTDTFFHVDVTQSFGKLNDEIKALQCDMLSFSAHKFGGPQGVGGLVLKRGRDYSLPPIRPLFYGGQQERGIRPGTTPVALIAGMSKAAEISEQHYVERMERCREIKQQFMDSISKLRYRINGSPEYCIPNTINISFDGVDAEGVFLAMKEKYAFSNGSACNSGSFSPSYVLLSMGLDEQRISEAVRISWSGHDGKSIDFSGLVDYVSRMQD